MHPVARAGATLHAIWFIGQFQGVMSPQTPIGSFAIRVVPRTSSNGKFLSTVSAASKCARPLLACARMDSDFGAPISSVMASAMSS